MIDLSRGSGGKGLLKVGNDVVNVLGTDGNADEILSDTRGELLLVGELLVGGGPGVDGKGLGVTDVGEVGDELEAVDNLGAGSAGAGLDAEGEDTAVAALEVLLGHLVRDVVLEAGVRHPADVLALLEPLGEGQGVLGVALGAEREGLDTEEELLGGEGVQAGTEVTEDLDADADDEGDGAEGLPELEAVVALSRLDHLGEALGVLAPVELAGVDDDTADGGAVAANPLGSRVDDDISTVLDGADEVTTGTEGVVNLNLECKSLAYNSPLGKWG